MQIPPRPVLPFCKERKKFTRCAYRWLYKILRKLFANGSGSRPPNINDCKW
jgi:hypothetical protein